jgi:hypothetical protein
VAFEAIWRCTSDMVTAAAAAMARRVPAAFGMPLDVGLAAPNIELRSNRTEAFRK